MSGTAGPTGAILDPKLLELTRDDPRYSYEAYEFVCEAVTYTQDRLGRLPCEDDPPDADYHVSGAELVRGTCELACEEFGLMAGVVFRQWGITCSDDVGELVFRLINSGMLSQSEEDDPADFRGLFDLSQALADGFVLTLDAEPEPAGER